jgi:hypothetical protein
MGLESGPDIADLRRRLLKAFRGRDAPIGEIEEFVVTQTPYRETHYKRPVLIPMEKADPPQLVVSGAPPGRKRYQYPPATVLRFL